MDHKEFLKIAREEMQRSAMKIKVGCAMTDEIGLVGKGFNEYHPNPTSAPWSIHAEVSALLQSVSNGWPRVAYVYRETPGGRIADAKPCIWCQRTMKKYGVEYVHYTAKDGPHVRIMRL